MTPEGTDDRGFRCSRPGGQARQGTLGNIGHSPEGRGGQRYVARDPAVAVTAAAGRARLGPSKRCPRQVLGAASAGLLGWIENVVGEHGVEGDVLDDNRLQLLAMCCTSGER